MASVHVHRIATGLLLCGVFATAGAPTGAKAGDDPAPVVEREFRNIKVERSKDKDPKLPSLRFLRDNRDFLRAQLDRMRLRSSLVRFRSATTLDERMLQLKAMGAALAAARDTVSHEHAVTDERELLAGITELGDLEDQLDLFEELLDAQRRRLTWLESDFLDQQRTALVFLVKGFAAQQAPAEILVTEQDETFRIALSPDQQRSLEQGGIAQVLHEFVEPRDHWYRVALSGNGWTEAEPAVVPVTAPRNRLTFVELDLAGLDPSRDLADLSVAVWQR